MVKGIIHILLSAFLFISCKRDNPLIPVSEYDSTFISAVDISAYPEISNSNPVFFDLEGNQDTFLKILKKNGVNTIRLRLWVNPINEHSGLNEVKNFSDTLKSKGFKTWLTLHYSDTWADPGHQVIPSQWQGISFDALRDSVYQYTQRVVNEIKPNYIQIGNEINSGFLNPVGNITQNYANFIDLMNVGIASVRANSSETEIIIHFAGIQGSDWFFSQVSNLDYDIIGLSYYPMWHGKSLSELRNKMQYLTETHNKKIVIAETAYPFTLEWNDWTNNIAGLQEHLILPQYPATPEGQRAFIHQIKTLIHELENGTGFCYWGAELIAWKGNQSKDGSPWENQALFDFQNKALPALKEFKIE
jgi:arabinogalactan endo-1,4-beta-galactosidase